jgi:MOSC domain-containing protein YiiM
VRQALAVVLAVSVGRPRREGGAWTAIAKAPVAGPVWVGPEGLAGDAQADRVHHGGPDKAVHAHFVVHLRAFGALRGRPVPPGSLGENLTWGAAGPGVPEPEEAAFCLGDVLRLGGAVLQVTQPRIPCAKQERRLGLPAAEVAASGRTGLYLRVLEPGPVAAGDRVVLLERPHPEATVALANRFLHGRPRDPALAARLRGVAGLGAELARILGAAEG